MMLLEHIIQVLLGHTRFRLSLTLPRFHRLYPSFSFFINESKRRLVCVPANLTVWLWLQNHDNLLQAKLSITREAEY